LQFAKGEYILTYICKICLILLLTRRRFQYLHYYFQKWCFLTRHSSWCQTAQTLSLYCSSFYVTLCCKKSHRVCSKFNNFLMNNFTKRKFTHILKILTINYLYISCKIHCTWKIKWILCQKISKHMHEFPAKIFS